MRLQYQSIGLLVLCLAMSSGVQAKKKKEPVWQQQLTEVQAQVKTVEDSATKNLNSAIAELTAQMQTLQASVDKQIEKLEAQIQDVHTQLNQYIENQDKSSA